MVRWVVVTVLGLCAGCASSSSSEQSAVPKQRPIPYVQGSMPLKPGTWATYDIHDRKQNTDSRMWFALDQRVKRDNGSALWIEVEVTQAGQPPVVTRFLAQETADGFGDLLEAIVQVKGYEPFRIPQKYLNAGRNDSPSFTKVSPAGGGTSQPATMPAPPPRKTVQLNGRTLHVYEASGQDQQGQPVHATVTEEVPPLALVTADTADVTMRLVDWGAGVQSKITGTPISMTWWITKQVVKGLAEDDSGGGTKP